MLYEVITELKLNLFDDTTNPITGVVMKDLYLDETIGAGTPVLARKEFNVITSYSIHYTKLYDVLFSGFQKKTQKTPKVEIEKAMRLKKEYFELKNERHDGL